VSQLECLSAHTAGKRNLWKILCTGYADSCIGGNQILLCLLNVGTIGEQVGRQAGRYGWKLEFIQRKTTRDWPGLRPSKTFKAFPLSQFVVHIMV